MRRPHHAIGAFGKPWRQTALCEYYTWHGMAWLNHGAQQVISATLEQFKLGTFLPTGRA